MSHLTGTRYYVKLINHKIKEYATFIRKQRLTIHFTNELYNTINLYNTQNL